MGCIEQFPLTPNKQIVDVPNEDYDNDGFTENEGDIHPDGSSADNDPDIYPGAQDICDGKDNDLNGEIDDDSTLHTEYYTDADQDGFGVLSSKYKACSPNSQTDIPFKVNRYDCDDTDISVYPGHLNQEQFGCYLDSDDDGYGDINAEFPYDSGSDCDDSNKKIYPGSLLKELVVGCYIDLDGDGFGDNNAESPFDEGTDCDDTRASVNPTAPELCDDLDNNCNDFIDGLNDSGDYVEIPVDGFVYFVDTDGDGFGSSLQVEKRCEELPPDFLSLVDTDCDDFSAITYPSAPELCDQVDNNCNGFIDGFDTDGNYVEIPDDGVIFYRDVDEDGYGDAQDSIKSCSILDGYVLDNTDCADGIPQRHPNADEYCNGIDDDCDGFFDEMGAVDAPRWYADFDNDGAAGTLDYIDSCSALDGYFPEISDCNDGNPLIHPLADELCDGIDNNCDNAIDGDDAIDPNEYYEDFDNDGFGSLVSKIYNCSIPDGYVENNHDCDDNNVDIHPDADEYCNEVDDNCNGIINEETAVDANTYYYDGDADGYGILENTTKACILPNRYSAVFGDCNDSNPSQRPSINEYCNDIDDDCDGLIDELFEEDNESPVLDSTFFYPDEDLDGFGLMTDVPSIESCPEDIAEGSGFTTNNTDCDDGDPLSNPMADEDCSEIDRNCDGRDILGAMNPTIWYIDIDRDNFGDPNVYFESCHPPFGFIADNTDCNDLDATVYPNAPELCTGRLEDCNYSGDFILEPIDEEDMNVFIEETQDIEDGFLTGYSVDIQKIPILEYDDDGDGYVECSLDINPAMWYSSQRQIEDISGNYVSGIKGGDDCDDTDNVVYADAPEICNGKYDNCASITEFGTEIVPDDEYDDDGDGYVECDILIDLADWYNSQKPLFDEEGTQISGVIGGGDCIDDNIHTYPGAAYLESPTECRLDATGPEGVSDGYSDCLVTDCEISIYLGEQSGVDAALDFNLVYSVTGGNLVDPRNGLYELTHSFYMMTTETTQAAFEKAMGYNISYYVGPEKPIDSISHVEGFVFANRISDHVGLPEEDWCYSCTMTEDMEPCVPDEDYTHANIYECPGYRLGTEWEIQYATLSGTSEYYWTDWDEDGNAIGGNIPNEFQKPISCNEITDVQIIDNVNNPMLKDYAWFCGVSNATQPAGYTSQEVAQLLPNGFGLYDLHGNQWELGHNWITDSQVWLEGDMETGIDPVGPEVGLTRARMGGFFGSKPFHLDFEYRFGYVPGNTNNVNTFRLVRTHFE